MEIVKATSKRGPDDHPHIRGKGKEAKKAVITKEGKREKTQSKTMNKAQSTKKAILSNPTLTPSYLGIPKNKRTAVKSITTDLQIRMN
eukprot:4973826-Ditylum_brightwellii.AAC.1